MSIAVLVLVLGVLFFVLSVAGFIIGSEYLTCIQEDALNLIAGNSMLIIASCSLLMACLTFELGIAIGIEYVP